MTVTQHGFDWHNIQVTRMTEMPNGRVVGVGTADKPYAVTVYVSNGGKSIRVSINGKEVKA